MKKLVLHSLSFAALTAIAPVSALANTILFQDNFNSQPLNETPGSPWTGPNQVGEGRIAEVIEDDQNWFGQGTSNRILQWTKTDTEDPMGLRAISVFDPTEVLTVSFSVYEPTPDETLFFFDVRLYAAGNVVSTNQAQRLQLGRGRIANDTNITYGQDTLAYFDFVVNNSNEPIVYGDGQTLAAGEVDIWLDGGLLAAGHSNQHNLKGGIESLQFNTVTAGTQDIYIDDFVIREGAFVIPEPRTAAFLAGLAAIGAVLLRRRGLAGTRS